MTEIGEETIGDIDHCMRDTEQQGAEFGARFGGWETATQLSALRGRELEIAPAKYAQPEKGIADRPGTPNDIAGFGAAARDFLPRRDLADRGQGQDSRTGGGNRIPAQQV